MNLIKNITHFYLIVFLFACSICNSSHAQEFIEGFEDLPVMNGMFQLQNDNISFGNEESRLVEAYLEGKGISFASVASFYRETLPQLGWNLINQDKKQLLFEREEERLNIVCEQKSPLLVRITLKSKN